MTAPLSGDEWVRSQPAERYTLQILGVGSLVSLDGFTKKYGLNDEVFYIETERNGKPWYALLWGAFPDKVSAIEAQKKLPRAVRNTGIWPRSFSELQKLLN